MSSNLEIIAEKDMICSYCPHTGKIYNILQKVSREADLLIILKQE